jgi:hypothetical protein
VCYLQHVSVSRFNSLARLHILVVLDSYMILKTHFREGGFCCFRQLLETNAARVHEIS